MKKFSLVLGVAFAVAMLCVPAFGQTYYTMPSSGGQTTCNKYGCTTVFPQVFSAPVASAPQPREFVVPASEKPTTVRIVVNEGTPSLYVLGESKAVAVAAVPVSTSATYTANSSYAETSSACSTATATTARTGFLSRIGQALKNRPRLFGGSCGCGG